MRWTGKRGPELSGLPVIFRAPRGVDRRSRIRLVLVRRARRTDIADFAGLIFVTSSPIGAKGSEFDQVPPPFGLAGPSYTGREHIVAEDNSASASYDAPKVAADAFPGSPNRDNVYFTWTVFDFSCGATHDQYCSSTIYASMSTDTSGVIWITVSHESSWSRSGAVFST